MQHAAWWVCPCSETTTWLFIAPVQTVPLCLPVLEATSPDIFCSLPTPHGCYTKACRENRNIVKIYCLVPVSVRSCVSASRRVSHPPPIKEGKQLFELETPPEKRHSCCGKSASVVYTACSKGRFTHIPNCSTTMFRRLLEHIVHIHSNRAIYSRTTQVICPSLDVELFVCAPLHSSDNASSPGTDEWAFVRVRFTTSLASTSDKKY